VCLGHIVVLQTQREIDDKAHTAPLMGNVANELMFQGRLADSMKI
jgi:hypothetical protein